VINIHKTIILPVVVYGSETWSLTLREEQRLRVYEKRVVRIFGHRGRKWWEPEGSCIMRSFVNCKLHQI
jgi:hypothetical protein